MKIISFFTISIFMSFSLFLSGCGGLSDVTPDPYVPAQLLIKNTPFDELGTEPVDNEISFAGWSTFDEYDEFVSYIQLLTMEGGIRKILSQRKIQPMVLGTGIYNCAVAVNSQGFSFYFEGVLDMEVEADFEYETGSDAITLNGKEYGLSDIVPPFYGELKTYFYAFSENQAAVLYNYSILEQSLVAKYDFETVIDSAVLEPINGNDGTLFGDTEIILGKTNHTAFFDGNDHMSATNDGSLDFSSEFGISFWMNPDINSSSSDMVLIGKGMESTDNYEIIVKKNDLKFEFYDRVTKSRTTVSTTGLGLVNNEWVHVTVVVNAKGAVFYINGESKFEYAREINLTTVSDGLFIGKNNGSSPKYFRGQLDEIKFFNKALSAEEVSILYDSSFL